MPKCRKCGEVFETSIHPGLCDVCTKASTSLPVHLPSTKRITQEDYQQEIDKAAATPPPPAPERTPVLPRLIAVLFPLLWLAVAGGTYWFFDMQVNRHVVIWSLCAAFFLLGLAMIITGRITFRRVYASEKLDPTRTKEVHLIVGIIWIIPFFLCLAYYAFSDNLPRTGAIWFVASTLVLALLAQVACARAFSPVADSR
jgi:hypothetical protein